MGVVHPGEETLFFHPFVPWSGQLAAGLSGTLAFQTQFWAVPERRESLSFKLRFTVTRLEPRTTEWTFLEGPSYV
jgi:hypothetical protein